MKGTLAEKRKRYYTMIWVYKGRRNKLRERYGIKQVHFRKEPLPEGYIVEVAKYSNKIKVWKRQIRNIDALNERLHNLEKAVIQFTHTKFKNINGYDALKKEIRLAKSLYYKFGLENGIRGKELRLHIGGIREVQPAAYRKKFTQSFTTNPENKETWIRFKEFYAA